MSRLPGEARDGLMRAWLEILRERHPSATWVPAEQVKQQTAVRGSATENAARSQAESMGMAAA